MPQTGTLRRHLPGLDGIRALAALLVMVFHFAALQPVDTPQPLSLVLATGWIGVDIFFAVSGFILFLPFARAALTGTKVDVRKFLRNRVLRIVPAFWFNTAVIVLVASTALLFTAHGWWVILQNLTFVMGYLPPTDRTYLNGVTWTLAIEMGFYLTLPLMARLFVKRRWMLGFPAVLAVSLTFNSLMIAHYGGSAEGHAGLATALSSLIGMYPMFAVGMIAAAVWARCEIDDVRIPAGAGLALALTGLAGIYAVIYFLMEVVGGSRYWDGSSRFGWFPLLFCTPAIAAFAALLIFGVCYSPNVLTRVLEWRPIAYLGVISYGIYLWHFEFARWLRQGMAEADTPHKGLVLMVAGTVGTLLIAWFSHRFVEEPFLRRKKAASTVATSAEPEQEAPAQIDLRDGVAQPASETVLSTRG